MLWGKTTSVHPEGPGSLAEQSARERRQYAQLAAQARQQRGGARKQLFSKGLRAFLEAG